MEINEDLAVIHAYLCADGYVIKNPPEQKHKYYVVGLRNTNHALLADFQTRFERLWGLKPKLEEGQRCSIHSKPLYEYLTTTFGSFYSRGWRMPHLNKARSRAWLRTYFDCEGWVSIESHKSRLIGADCVNLPGLEQVKSALAKNGIESNLKAKNGKDIFRLYIYGKDNLTRFEELIGFYHPQKRIKLHEAISNYVTYSWSFPKTHSKLKGSIKAIMLSKARVQRDNGVVRVISREKANLTLLQKSLKLMFNVEATVNEMVNGLGTRYYQLNIYKKDEVKRAIKRGLLNLHEVKKWSKSKR